MLYPNLGPQRLLSTDLAVTVELIAAAIFALLAGVSYDAASIGAVFAATMFLAAFASGAHITPAVSVASALSGHLPWMRVLFYVLAQVLGSLGGTALLLWLVPGVHASGSSAAACHGPPRGLGGTGLFAWEALLTFVFVFVLYGAILHPPGHGAVAPLTAGITLFACLAAGGAFTGLSPLNPAITLASSIVFGCYWRFSWMYWLAQLTGAGVAAGLAVFVYGRGPYLLDEEGRQAYLASYMGVSGGGGSQPTGGIGRFYAPLLSGEERTAAPHGTAGVGGGGV